MEDVTRHFINLSSTQVDQLSALGALYKEWNAKINVISRKDIDNLYPHHVLHSLAIAKYVQFNANDVVLDAGTGGGFPGLPLAIMFPKTSFTLADSIGKKLTVIDAIASSIGVANITTIHSRVESLPGGYDYVVSRAVTRLDDMWRWVGGLIRQDTSRNTANGLLYLKGGDISTEIPHNCFVQTIPLQQLINEPQFTEKSLVHIYKK
jgi:16S rRNA (guanine527-N7)-methyltransferase